MPSISNLKIAANTEDVLSNVRRDIRAFCTEYKSRLDNAEFTTAYVKTVTNQQGLALVAVLQSRLKDNEGVILAALADWSIADEDLTDDYQLLRSAAEAMRDATNGNVFAVLTQILSQVEERPRLW